MIDAKLVKLFKLFSNGIRVDLLLKQKKQKKGEFAKKEKKIVI
jgi:hypothetical protein